MPRVKKQQDASNTPDLSQAERERLYAEFKSRVIEDLKTEEDKRRDALIKKREEDKESYRKYVETMKESTDPWVDILGIVHTEQGVRIELEWNDAFVQYLRSNGLTGVEEEAVVQKWVTLLLRDMADDMEQKLPNTKKSEYA